MTREEQLARVLAELVELTPAALAWVEVADDEASRLERKLAEAERLLTPDERNRARPWSPPQPSTTS